MTFINNKPTVSGIPLSKAVEQKTVQSVDKSNTINIEQTEKTKSELTPQEQKIISSNSTIGSGSLSFIDEVKTNNDKVSVKESFGQIDKQVNLLVKNKNISEPNTEIISKKLNDLSQTLKTNKLSTPEDIKKVSQNLNSLVIALKNSGIKTELVNANINQLMNSICNDYSEKNNLNLELVNKNDHLMGIKVNQSNLSPTQNSSINELKNTAINLEKLKVQNPKNITNYDLVIMSVRDELLRSSYERLAIRPDDKLLVPIENDLKIINNMVSSVDQMLSGTRNIPNNMLTDLSNLTKVISEAPVGEIDKKVKEFSDNLAKTKDLGISLPNIPNTSKISDLNNELISLTKNTPTGVGDNVKSVIQSYSKAMDIVENNLPPILPFPVTLNMPIGYDNGSGNKFLLAPGSTLSQNGKGFKIDSPSMLLENGSTQISTSQTQIQLGNGLDGLSMGSLNINNPNTQTQLTNIKAEIDRNNGTSVIKADKAIVDMTDGKIELTNTGLYQNSDGSLKLVSDSFWYEKNDTNIGMKDFQAVQSEKDGINNLNVSANKIDFKNADTVVTADKFIFDMKKNENDNSSQALLGAENVKVLNGGNQILADKADIEIIQNADGSGLTKISSENPDIKLKNGNQLSVKGNTSVKLVQNTSGNLESISAKADELNYKDKLNEVKVNNGSLDIKLNNNGTLDKLTSKADKVLFNNKDNSVIAENANINLDFENNKLNTLNGSVDKLNYNSKQGNLDITKGDVEAKFDTDGTLTNIKAGVDKLNYLSDKGDKLDVKGLGVEINNGKDGLESANVTAGQIDYLSNKGDSISIKNGAASLNRDIKGDLTSINASADNIAFNNKKGDNINAIGTEININSDKNGLKDASIKVGNLDYSNIKGDKLNLVNGSANIIKDDKGLISKISGSADKLNAIDKNGNNLLAEGLKVNLINNGEQGYNLNASVNKLNLDMVKENININVNQFNLGLTDNQITMHVDSAEIIKKVENELNVKVENLDVVVDKTKEGALRAVDVQLANLDGAVKGMNMMVKTQNGDRVRLNMSLSEDGKMLKEAFLQIPKGGEIKIEKDDLKVSLGEQLIKFTQNDGVYTLRNDGMNIAAQFKGGKVQVNGGSAQLSMDTKSGNLIIDEIKGTKINAEFGKNKVDVDIKEITGFMVKTTGLSGPVNGLSLELVPTKDDSKITVSVRANIGGMPVKVDLDDVHHLKASGSIGVNQAHVYFGDASGRGKVTLGAGPLEMKGSAIEFLAKYNTYNPERMMSSVSRYISNDGLKIGALTLEADGVARLEKQSSGLHLGATVLVPRVWEKAYDLVGMNNNGSKDGSWGAILSVGGQGKSGDGTKYMGSIYGGLVPGSYFSVKQLQGTTSIYNVPLPSNINAPTTVMGGLMFRRENDSSKLGATVGGYVNPVGLIPENSGIPLQDKTMYGGFAGVNYRTKNLQFNLDALVDVNKDFETGSKKLAPGFRAGVSFSF